MAEVVYDVFISYRATSGQMARRLKSALEGLGRRHDPDSPTRVYLDTSSMTAGSLSGAIRSALETSRALIVLLAEDTIESVWVDREIQHWLDNGGHPSRLFLIRVDDRVNLSWDDAAKGFVHPLQIPASLRTVFAEEQKWIDLATTQKSLEQTAIAPIFASVKGIRPETLLLEEAAFQRRRRRVLSGAVVVVVVLLMLALVAGGLALISRGQANESSRRAEAQAFAAQAILMRDTSPTEAIRNALEGAALADTPSVRAALLQVAADPGGLLRAIPTQSGTATGADVDPTVQTVATYGTSGDEVYLQLDTLDAGRRLVRMTRRGDAIDAQLLSPTQGVLCVTGDDSVLGSFAVGAGRTITLSETTSYQSGEGGGCAMTKVGQGVVIQYSAQDGDWASEYRDGAGRIDLPDGLSVGKVSPDGTKVLLLSDEGAAVLDTSARSVKSVDAPPIDVGTYADDRGWFFVKLVEQRAWGFIRPGADGPTFRAADTGAETIDAAPVLEGSDLTSDVATISLRSEFKTTAHDDVVLPLGNRRGDDSIAQFQPRLWSAPGGRFIAVFAQTAYVLAAGELDLPHLDNSWQRHEDTYAVKQVTQSLGAPEKYGIDPLRDGCGSTALLRHGSNDTMMVDDSGDFRVLAGDRHDLTPSCSVLDRDPNLSFRGMHEDEDVVLRTPLVAQSTLVTDAGIILVNGRGPTEVIAADGLATKPWRTAQRSGGVVATALGQRVITQDSTSLTFRRAGARSKPRSVELGSADTLLAVAPDGRTVLVDPGEAEGAESEPVYAVGPGVKRHPLVEECHFPTYSPSAGFETSIEAATTYVPVIPYGAGGDTNGYTNCASGKEWRGGGPPPTRYEFTDAAGVIEYGDGQREHSRVSWQKGDDVPVKVDAPPGLNVSWSDSGDRVSVSDDDDTYDTYRRVEGQWRKDATVRPRLQLVAATRFLGDTNLLMAVGAKGDFEIIETTTGRSVAYEPSQSLTDDTADVVGVSEEDGYVYIGLGTGNAVLASREIIVPVEVPVLTRFLCTLVPVSPCPSS